MLIVCALFAADPALISQVEASVKEQVAIVGELSEVASKHPYYKLSFSQASLLVIL